ncbi:WLM domain-containing protein, partial [Pyronema omphalodes]
HEHPIMPLIETITYLSHLPRSQEALAIMRRVVSIVKPIMVAGGYRLKTFAEMLPENPGLQGLNYDHGYKLCIRLRFASDPSKFLPFEDIMCTMLHELTHNVYGPHDEKFYGHLRKLEDEYYALKARGWNGSNFSGSGNTLSEAPRNLGGLYGYQRKHAVAAMERRIASPKESEQRLYGGIANDGRLSQGEIKAQVAERRKWDEKHCSGDFTSAGEVGGASIGGFKEDLEEEAWLKEQIKEIYRGWGEDENSANVVTPTDSVKTPGKALTKPAQKSPQNSSIWSCSRCTLKNPISRTRCEACDSPRSKLSGSSGSSSQPNLKTPSKAYQMLQRSDPPTSKKAGWACSVCSTKNEHEFWTCSTCGWMKGKSFED